MSAADTLSADLRAALGDLSSRELDVQLAVFVGVRDAQDAEGHPKVARLHDVLVALCGAEKRRRRGEVKALDSLYRHGEEPSTWWGSPDVR